MTREERINSALSPILEKMREHGATDEMCKMYDNGFHVGAMWADAHPRWISVEEELPKEHEWILGYSLKREYIDVYNFDSNGLIEAHGITHWMRLPQAPELSNSGKTGKDLKGGEQ